MKSRLLRQLEAVDWDFPSRPCGLTNAIHWYPGTFPSQLPATLIEALTKPDDVIFDPYGGIGTTVLEALRMGRKGWATEHNPVGYLAAHVMSGLLLTNATQAAMVPVLMRELDRVIFPHHSQPDFFSNMGHPSKLDLLEFLDGLMRPTSSDIWEYIAEKRVPRWDLLEPWIAPRTLNQVRESLARIKHSSMPSFAKLTGLIMLSAVLRPSSSQTRSWGHIADRVLPTEMQEKPLVQLCRRWLTITQSVTCKALCVPLTGDARRVVRVWLSLHDWGSPAPPSPKPPKGINLLLTSPPYAGAIDYIRAQRLSLYLLGFSDPDINAMGLREIGARRKRFSSQNEDDWSKELSQALSCQLRYVTKDGIIVFVMPHKDAGRTSGITRIRQTLSAVGWEPFFTSNRSIRQLRTRQSWTSIKRETIQMFHSNTKRGF